MKRLGLLLLLLLAVMGALAGYAFARALDDPVVRTTRLSLPGWPAGTPPLRAVLLSDVHVGGATMTPERLARLVARVNALRPDLVLVAGDFVSGHDPEAGARYAGMLGPLGRLRARLGTVAVLGNHDHWTAPARVRAALARAGVRVLENAAARAGPLTVGGLDDAFSGRADPGRVAALLARAGGPSLVLTHDPAVAPRLPRGTVVLAGHTHCGQVVLPGLGPLVTYNPLIGRTLIDPRYRCGVVRDAGGRTAVISAGLGTSSLPFRLGAPPDLWLLTIGG